MGLRLLILDLWTPKYIIRKELENISVQTTTALETLASKYNIETADLKQKRQPKTIQEQRMVMAKTQAKLVEKLKHAVGHQEAVKLSRNALFSVGRNLGKQARNNLGVSDTQNDLTRAARILYRILGIEFHLEWHSTSSATLIIDRCALAEEYSKLTCEVLCATDEGVINGLQPKVTMKFKEYMTSGCKNCRAHIHFERQEVED